MVGSCSVVSMFQRHRKTTVKQITCDFEVRFAQHRPELKHETAVENLCSRKSGPKFTKLPYDLLRANAPHCAKFPRARPNDVRKKRYNFFYTLQYFGAPRDP